jgi:sporulation protein YlmC with PRC-barrel domain
MRYNLNAEVLSYDGRKVGELQHIVIDPHTHKVSHLIVRKGFLFKSDKVLPQSLVASTTGQEINLYQFEGTLDDMPDYEEINYVMAGDYTFDQDENDSSMRPLFVYPPLGQPLGVYPIFPRMLQQPVVEKNIPLDKVAIQDGARIIALHGDDLGEIMEIITDPITDQATDIVIQDPDGQRKRIPINWVKDLQENSIQLIVDANLVEHLPEHRPLETA